MLTVNEGDDILRHGDDFDVGEQPTLFIRNAQNRRSHGIAQDAVRHEWQQRCNTGQKEEETCDGDEGEQR